MAVRLAGQVVFPSGPRAQTNQLRAAGPDRQGRRLGALLAVVAPGPRARGSSQSPSSPGIDSPTSLFMDVPDQNSSKIVLCDCDIKELALV